MFQLVKIIDSSAPHQGDIRCCKKNVGEADILYDESNKIILSTSLFTNKFNKY